MIKINGLTPTGKPGYHINGDVISLPIIRKLLLQCNDKYYGLPITISSDQIQSGGLLHPQFEDCLLLRNIEHANDYFQYCITLTKQDTMAKIEIRYHGTSVLSGEMNSAGKHGGKLMRLLRTAIQGANQVSMAAEYEYYEILDEMCAKAFQSAAKPCDGETDDSREETAGLL